MKVLFKIFVVHLDEKPHLYTLSERVARGWAKQKGQGFKVKGILIWRKR